jgi:hypothetical protein
MTTLSADPPSHVFETVSTALNQTQALFFCLSMILAETGFRFSGSCSGMHHRPVSWLAAVIQLAFPPMHGMFNAEWTRIAKTAAALGRISPHRVPVSPPVREAPDDSPNKHSGTTRASRERIPGIAAKYGEPQFHQSCER